METIGKIIATEKLPSTIEEFTFWTNKERKLKPFDVVVVEHHIDNSKTFGVVEEIAHITDAPSPLAGFISSDFGQVDSTSYTDRIGMNYVKCKVVGNSANIYIPVTEGSIVRLASQSEIMEALGLNDVKNPVPAGYIQMYDGTEQQILPVHFNSHFLIGPEGAHLNISGMSGLASKTSYTMFLLKALQDTTQKRKEESVAFILMNVKGTDLLSIDQKNAKQDELDEIQPIYDILGLEMKPFQHVTYYYPYSSNATLYTYEKKNRIESRVKKQQAFQFKYLFETPEDKECLELLFANVDDPNDTIDAIISYIIAGNGAFRNVETWEDFRTTLSEQANSSVTDKKGQKNEIPVVSWRKFYRLFNKCYQKNQQMFTNSLGNSGIRLRDKIADIKGNEVMVIDIAKLDDESKGFVFGDVMHAVNELKMSSEREDIPDHIIIFIDELNKYASNDAPKSSPILRQLLEITERGRSSGIVLFGAEQFVSDIHKRVKGNCATQAFGRTNAIEITKDDFRFIPQVYKTMLTRLKQGEYIIQNPVFRSLLNIKFPKPIYKYYNE